MSKRIFSFEQIENLLKNPNVTKCSPKSISYNNQFKMNAVKQYCESGLPVRHIFVNAGFDLNVIGDRTPKNCLNLWKKIFKSRGVDGLASERRGKGATGRPRVREISDADRIKRLEATVAYLKAENDFLTKLRARSKS